MSASISAVWHMARAETCETKPHMQEHESMWLDTLQTSRLAGRHAVMTRDMAQAAASISKVSEGLDLDI